MNQMPRFRGAAPRLRQQVFGLGTCSQLLEAKRSPVEVEAAVRPDDSRRDYAAYWGMLRPHGQQRNSRRPSARKQGRPNVRRHRRQAVRHRQASRASLALGYSNRRSRCGLGPEGFQALGSFVLGFHALPMPCPTEGHSRPSQALPSPRIIRYLQGLSGRGSPKSGQGLLRPLYRCPFAARGVAPFSCLIRAWNCSIRVSRTAARASSSRACCSNTAPARCPPRAASCLALSAFCRAANAASRSSMSSSDLEYIRITAPCL